MLTVFLICLAIEILLHPRLDRLQDKSIILWYGKYPKRKQIPIWHVRDNGTEED